MKHFGGIATDGLLKDAVVLLCYDKKYTTPAPAFERGHAHACGGTGQNRRTEKALEELLCFQKGKGGVDGIGEEDNSNRGTGE